MVQDKKVYKKIGRPPGRRFGSVIPVRLSPQASAKIEKWAERHSVSRSEAIRQIIELGLKREAH